MHRFGLIGCGHIARRHADILSSGAVEGAVLGAVCDIVPERARVLGETYGVPYFNDLAQLFARGDVDVACVLTPSGLHHDHCLAAAAAGKHVVVEKPMALRIDDADAMIRACIDAGVRLFVVKQLRFHAPVVMARQALEANRFGRLVLGSVRVWWRRDQAYYDSAEWRGTWALDGGVLMNQAIHYIDLLQWFFGPAKGVRAIGRTALLDVEVEDTAVGIIEFSNGALATVEATTAARPVGVEGSLSILGERGTVLIGGLAADRIDLWNFGDSEVGTQALSQEADPNVAPSQGHRDFYAHVVKCLENGGSGIDGREARKSLEIAAALYESMETGQTVRLDNVCGHSALGRRQ